MYAPTNAVAGGSRMGEIVPRFGSELNELLEIDDGRISGRSFDLYAGGVGSSSLDQNGPQDERDQPKPLVYEPSLRSFDSATGMWTVIILDAIALEKLVKSRIAQLQAQSRDGLGGEALGAAAGEVVAPGMGLAGHAALASTKPVLDAIGGLFGFGQSGDDLSIAMKLAAEGVRPQTFRQSDQAVERAIGDREPSLVRPAGSEELERQNDDDRAGAGDLADVVRAAVGDPSAALERSAEALNLARPEPVRLDVIDHERSIVREIGLGDDHEQDRSLSR